MTMRKPRRNQDVANFAMMIGGVMEIMSVRGSILYSAAAEDFRQLVSSAVNEGANLYGANLRDAGLYGANLRGANLCGADLRYADLRGAGLYVANLRDANLRDANLCGADLRGAGLYGANLRDANLRDANLCGADLRYADLRDAGLYGADLRGADLCGADLCGAGLCKVQLMLGVTAEGDRPFLTIGPIGGRKDYLMAWITNKGVMVRAGCFFGTRDLFSAEIQRTHGDNIHGQEYRAALALIDKHAELWTPPAEREE